MRQDAPVTTARSLLLPLLITAAGAAGFSKIVLGELLGLSSAVQLAGGIAAFVVFATIELTGTRGED
jgi:hypothetical protein